MPAAKNGWHAFAQHKHVFILEPWRFEFVSHFALTSILSTLNPIPYNLPSPRILYSLFNMSESPQALFVACLSGFACLLFFDFF